MKYIIHNIIKYSTINFIFVGGIVYNEIRKKNIKE